MIDSYINYKLFMMFIGSILKLHVSYEKENFPLTFSLTNEETVFVSFNCIINIFAQNSTLKKEFLMH
jgi:hypothetical protein